MEVGGGEHKKVVNFSRYFFSTTFVLRTLNMRLLRMGSMSEPRRSILREILIDIHVFIAVFSLGCSQ